METFPTIYKRDSKGNVREWRMELDGNRYRTISGLQDGQQVTTEWTVVEGKNVGRANETTAEEQARSEVESQYEKKLKVDYHKSLKNVDVAKIYQPMLAKKWEDRKDKINYKTNKVTVQPKLDGIRCIANSDGLWSRTGKPIVAVPHIWEALAPVFEKYPDVVLDGELYNHHLKHDFNAIVSMVRKTKLTPVDLTLSEERVQYHVYDLPSHEGKFSERFSAVIDIFMEHQFGDFTGVPGPSDHMIQLVETLNVTSEEDVDHKYGQFIQQGYEGGIIRLDAPYEQKRSGNLLKRKDFDDDEFTIVGIEEGSGNWSGYAKVCVFTIPGVTDNVPYNKLPRATIQGSQSYAKHVLENCDSYIGKQVTVQYFNLTPDGVPRFPIAKVLHEDKRW